MEFWVVMLLFLFGGIILNIYLNHPCYEPRERDYAYVLSFFAFAIWIGIGVDSLPNRWRWLALLAPLTLAVGNWSDHDRHNSHAVHDIASNHLESCEHDAILLTFGDNDTFPLWYLQQVEGLRTDIDIYNLGLTGWGNIVKILNDNDFRRPVYFSQYFYDLIAPMYPGRLRCEGYCWRLLPTAGEDLTPIVHEGVEWHITDGEYLDPVTLRFLTTWEKNTGGKVTKK